MRVIKFRFWDNQTKSFIHSIEDGHLVIPIEYAPLQLNLITPTIYENTYEWHWDSLYEDVFFMQWTGLSDMNGVDIYEGDIVVYGEEDYPLTVEYNDALARFECIGQEDVDYTFENFSASRELRVVGNIFQNKERLNIESDRL